MNDKEKQILKYLIVASFGATLGFIAGALIMQDHYQQYLMWCNL